MYCKKVKKYSLFMILVSFLSINSMVLRDNISHKKSNLKCIRHPNGKLIFCLPMIPGEGNREGFVINKQVCPHRIVGTFPGARYRQCVEKALLSEDGKYFVFVTGAQYRSSLQEHIKNVFIIDTQTLQAIDMLTYHNVVSAGVSMNDDSRHLTIPKEQGCSMIYDVRHHRHI